MIDLLSKEEIEKVKKILSCDNCPTSYACEACDITWSDKQLIKKYISELEQENNTLKHTNKSHKGIVNKQNKVIDLMTEQLAGLAIWNNEKEEPLILGDKEDVKKYFERK